MSFGVYYQSQRRTEAFVLIVRREVGIEKSNFKSKKLTGILAEWPQCGALITWPSEMRTEKQSWRTSVPILVLVTVYAARRTGRQPHCV